MVEQMSFFLSTRFLIIVEAGKKLSISCWQQNIEMIKTK